MSDAARTKSINFVGKHSESKSPAPKAAKAIPKHLPFEHTVNHSPALISFHYMPYVLQKVNHSCHSLISFISLKIET